MRDDGSIVFGRINDAGASVIHACFQKRQCAIHNFNLVLFAQSLRVRILKVVNKLGLKFIKPS